MKLYLLTALSLLLQIVLAMPTATSRVFQSDKFMLDFANVKDVNFVQQQRPLSKQSELTESSFEALSNVYIKSVEVEVVDGPVYKEDFSFPISNCLISYEGSGGSIGYSGSFGISSSASITPGLADPIANAITLSGSLTVGKSFLSSLSYSCTASAKGVAQLLATPIYASFRYRTKETYFNSFSNEILFEDTKWSPIMSGSMPVLQTPVFHCVNASAAICSIPPTNLTLSSTFQSTAQAYEE